MKKRRQRSKEEWAGHIRNQLVSGLTIEAYCKDHGLSNSQYYKVRKELREQGVALAGSPTGFALVKKMEPKVVTHSEVRIELGEELTIYGNIAAVIAIVKELRC